MFISKAQELRRQNAETHGKMCAIVKKAQDENRAITAEEDQEWQLMDAEFETRQVEIQKHEKLEKRERDDARLDTRRAGREPGQPAPARPEDGLRSLNGALRAFLTQERSQWSDDDRDYIQRQHAAIPPELRALGLTDAAGGFTVADLFMAELDKAQLSFSGIMQAARQIRTATGAAMPWPTVNDSGNKGHILSEGVAAADNVDPVFAAVTLDAFLYTSDILRVANQLMMDSEFNLSSELALMIGERLGRILNEHGTTGDGSSKPRGVVTAVLADTTPIAAASATAISYLDLVDLQHGVDPAYRQRNPVWMMHDDILKALKKLVDLDGRPAWGAGIAAREPSMILGSGYFINQDMDSVIQAAAESVLYGDFSKYIIRRVMNPVIVKLSERYAEYFQTAFVAFDRWDSDLVDAGTGPIQILQH